MASWNDITVNSQLSKCPVCLCSLKNVKRTTHVTDCYERNKVQMSSLGVIRCPLDSLHILPISFLNHHLEGNCQEAQNMLRKFYQKTNGMPDNYTRAPAEFDPGFPPEYINEHNRNLLYLLEQDQKGNLGAI